MKVHHLITVVAAGVLLVGACGSVQQVYAREPVHSMVSTVPRLDPPRAIPLEGGSTALADTAGDWALYYATRQTGPLWRHDLTLVNRADPHQRLRPGSALLGPAGRFRFALSPDYVVWQAYTPAGPGDRYTLGQTHVFRMHPQQEWDLWSVGWAERMQIAGEELVVERVGGATERHRLVAPMKSAAEARILQADFDGNGQPDTLLGRTNKVGWYEAVRVVSDGGRTLLDLTTPAPGLQLGTLPLVQAVDAGGRLPILLLGNVGGSGGQTLMAFGYSPAQQRMVPLPWDQEEREWGFPFTDPNTRTIIVGHRTYDYVRHMGYLAYARQDGRLTVQDRWYGPRPEEISVPRDPTFLLLAAFTSVSMNLPAETRRYFVAPQQAQHFFAQLAGLAAPGAVWSTATGQRLAEPAAEEPTRFVVRALGGTGGEVTVTGRVSFVRQDEQILIGSIEIAPG